MKYKVLSPLSHNNTLLEIGTIVELPEDVAETLLKDPEPAIAIADENAPAKPEPKGGEKKGAFNPSDEPENPVDAPVEPTVEPVSLNESEDTTENKTDNEPSSEPQA